MAMIDCHHLTKSFGHVTALRGVSMALTAGRVTGLLGPNGAGKSTLLRIVLGLVSADSGTVRIAEGPHARIGASVDGPAFYPWLSGAQNLSALLGPAGVTRRELTAALDRVGLLSVAGRRVSGYSAGMRQRLAIAAAIAGAPPVVLLDEPTNGLDPAGFLELRGVIEAERARGAAVLFSSHLLAEAAQVCDDVVMLSQGSVVVDGPLADITADGLTLEEHFIRSTTGTLT